MDIYNTLSLAHPFPYQGSKRNIAKYILPHFPSDIKCLIEPFCGAAAISIAASAHGLAERIVLNDINTPLMNLWKEILESPNQIVDKYEELWLRQQPNSKEFFLKIREEFNHSHQPHHLLYLLARIVKGSVRYSANGTFNQSPDNRRLGMKPNMMRKNILRVSHILKNKTNIKSVDFREVAYKAKKQDLVYMDPPYQGTSSTKDHRYLSGLTYDFFVNALSEMNEKGISFIVSYDGITGEKQHGKSLPLFLSLKHLYIHAGRSSQATLLGADDKTIESLYLSPALVERLVAEKQKATYVRFELQQKLALI